MAEITIQRVFAVMFNELERWVVPKTIFNRSKIPSTWEILPVRKIVQSILDRERE